MAAIPVGEVLVRPTRMGVCSTDLELCKGYMGFSGVLGHEFVGVVEAVGKGVDKAWVGKRVVGEINCVCGQCDMCVRVVERRECEARTNRERERESLSVVVWWQWKHARR